MKGVGFVQDFLCNEWKDLFEGKKRLKIKGGKEGAALEFQPGL